jgi:thioredoxin 1
VTTNVDTDKGAMMMTSNKDAMMMTGNKDTMMSHPAAYVSYSAVAVTQALAAKKHVVLFFYAPRCPSCRGLDKDLVAELATLPADSMVFKVDYDSSSDLKQKYGVTTQHTVVSIDAQENMIAKKIGADLGDIISLVK